MRGLQGEQLGRNLGSIFCRQGDNRATVFLGLDAAGR